MSAFGIACARKSFGYFRFAFFIDRQTIEPAKDSFPGRFIISTRTPSRLCRYICLYTISLLATFVSLPPRVFGQSEMSSSQQAAAHSALLQNNLNAANQGNVQAQLAVAKAYNGGIGVRRNYKSAFTWFQVASDQGNTEATAWLGSLYLFGRGVPQNVNRASSLIQAAVSSNDPVGLRFLGVMYQNGQGFTQNYRKASQLYSKAGSLGDPNAFDDLGLLYYRGLGVKRNMRMALQLFTKGASLGDSSAEFHLGEMYESGHVRPDHTIALRGPGNTPPKLTPDYATALKLYAQSAAQGNGLAAYKVGAMYEAGAGAPQSYVKAIQYYEDSRLYPPSLLALGRLYELGLGTSVNLLDAYAAYSLAAVQNAEAAERLRSLERRLTSNQLAAAKALLPEFRSSLQTP